MTGLPGMWPKKSGNGCLKSDRANATGWGVQQTQKQKRRPLFANDLRLTPANEFAGGQTTVISAGPQDGTCPPEQTLSLIVVPFTAPPSDRLFGVNLQRQDAFQIPGISGTFRSRCYRSFPQVFTRGNQSVVADRSPSKPDCPEAQHLKVRPADFRSLPGIGTRGSSSGIPARRTGRFP